MADIPYGHDYPEPIWPDEDGRPMHNGTALDLDEPPDDQLEEHTVGTYAPINGSNGHLVADDSHQPARPTFRSQLLSVADLAKLPPALPLVDGLLYQNTLAQISGAPGTYKSFVAIDVACALASGQNSWEGHRIPERTRVVYVAAEGANGLRRRILAWCEHHCVDQHRLDDWLMILPLPIQLGAVVEVDDAADMAREVRAGLLVLDTRARCTLGLKENDNTEQGMALAAAERIRAAAGGCTVWGIHHTGRDGSHPRGANAWDGGVWTDLRLTKPDTYRVEIEVEKHKDEESGRKFEYRLIPHTVSETLMPGVEEKHRKSLVVFSLDDENSAQILTGSREKLANLAEKSCGVEGLTRTQLVDLAVDAGMTKATAYRGVNELIGRSFLANVGTEQRRRYCYVGPTLDSDESGLA